MSSFNKVMLMGNLTRDPELKYLPSNTALCELGLAVNRKWRDKEGGSHDETCFVQCTAFGRQAETLNQYMSKGKPIFIEGRLKFDSWEAQDGSKRSRLSVVIENFQFIGARGDSSAGTGGSSAGDRREATYDAATGAPASPPPAPSPSSAPPPPVSNPPSGDDIPF